MRSLVKELEHEIEEADRVTPDYDNDPALVGGQDELPDALQRAIIKKKTGKSPQQENRAMKITKGQLRRIIREGFGYRNISDEYYWRNPYPFYWFCEAELSGWTYYAVVMEDWQGDFYWSVHEKKEKLPARMSEKTTRSLMKRKTVPPSPNSGPGKGRADSLEAAKSLAEKQLDGILLHFDDFKKKYGIQE